jgi:hypothetical protein
MEYVNPELLGHKVFDPVMKAGEPGVPCTFTARQLLLLLKHAFESYTQMLPPEVPALAVMDMVPCPETMVHPAGTDHLYPVTPATGATE